MLTAPVVTGITPTQGPAAGGTQVTISGSGLGSSEAVYFGTTPARGLYIYSFINNTLTVSSPPGLGIVDVIVDSPSGEPSAPSAADRFTYVQPPPTVSSVSAGAGPTAGGTTVTITGSNFTNTTGVYFGGIAAAGFAVKSDTQIAATSPAGVAGTVDVSIVTPGGASQASSTDQFIYLANPAVTGVGPATGSTAG
ncbi:IPT/TIG domain-containing protein, partial [Singulisphaera rosea]